MKNYSKIVIFLFICNNFITLQSSEFSKPALSEQEKLDKNLAELAIKMRSLTAEEQAMLPVTKEEHDQLQIKKQEFLNVILSNQLWTENLFDQINANFEILKTYDQDTIMKIIKHLFAIPLPFYSPEALLYEDLQTTLIYDIVKLNGILHKILSLNQIKSLPDQTFDKFLHELSLGCRRDPMNRPGNEAKLILLQKMSNPTSLYPINAINFNPDRNPYLASQDIRQFPVWQPLLKEMIETKEFNIDSTITDLIEYYTINANPENTRSPNLTIQSNLLDLIAFSINHGGNPDEALVSLQADIEKKEKYQHKPFNTKMLTELQSTIKKAQTQYKRQAEDTLATRKRTSKLPKEIRQMITDYL